MLRPAPNGDVVWTAHVRVKEAFTLRFQLSEVELPEGTTVSVYAPGKAAVDTSRDLVQEGVLWCPTSEGEVSWLEIRVPRAALDAGLAARFRVAGILEGFRLDADGNALTADAGPRSLSCIVDATCITTSTFADIDVLRYSVAHLRFTVNGLGYMCTGGLLNDTNSSFTPYLLTANHCFSTQASASSLEAYFDYHTSICNGSYPSYTNFPRTVGATLLATGATSDFTFVQLSGSLPGYRYFLGWTTGSVSNGTRLYRVSHPSGYPQQYSTALVSTSPAYYCSDRPLSNYIYTVPDYGAIAGGSSGAPTIISGGYAVGQLFGTCSYGTPDPCGYAYNSIDGAFATTYNSISSWIAPSVATVTLTSASVSPVSVNAGSSTTITYSLSSTAAATVLLGASVRPSGTTSWTISDPPHDAQVSLPSGSSTRSRLFAFASNTTPGWYDLMVAVWRDVNGNGIIDSGDQMLSSKTYSSAIQVLNCSYSVSPTALTIGSDAGTGTISVTTSSSCSWTAQSDSSWLTITSGSGTGNGTVWYSVSANTTTSARTGHITVGNATFTLQQNGIPICTMFSLLPTSLNVGASAGSQVVTITASPPGCQTSWLASGNGSWISVSPTSGSGSGSTTVSWTQNTLTTSRSDNASIAGIALPVNQSGTSGVHGYYTVTPCRLLDTRNPTGPYGGPSLASGAIRNVVAAGRCSLPSGVTAIALNVVAVQAPWSGWLTLYAGPAGSTRPWASTLNYQTSRTTANNALVPMGSDGSINVYNSGPYDVHCVIDVSGYFQ